MVSIRQPPKIAIRLLTGIVGQFATVGPKRVRGLRKNARLLTEGMRVRNHDYHDSMGKCGHRHYNPGNSPTRVRKIWACSCAQEFDGITLLLAHKKQTGHTDSHNYDPRNSPTRVMKIWACSCTQEFDGITLLLAHKNQTGHNEPTQLRPGPLRQNCDLSRFAQRPIPKRPLLGQEAVMDLLRKLRNLWTGL